MDAPSIASFGGAKGTSARAFVPDATFRFSESGNPLEQEAHPTVPFEVVAASDAACVAEWVSEAHVVAALGSDPLVANKRRVLHRVPL